jgi:transposase
MVGPGALRCMRTAPTDMRKGFDSLCARVIEQVARDPLTGDVYVFLSRHRIRAKVLHFA